MNSRQTGHALKIEINVIDEILSLLEENFLDIKI